MTECTIHVKGMYCTACENRIQKGISRLVGVNSCRADYQKEEVHVCFDEDLISKEKIYETIGELGYETKSDLNWYVHIGSILLILLAIYMIADHMGWTSIFRKIPEVQTTMSYGMVFVIGVLSSVHCIAMCGGINLSQSVIASKNNNAVIRSNLFYNFGRILSYTVIGGLAGGIGSVITFHGRLKGLMAILSGTVMVIMGLNMLGIFKTLRRFHIQMPNEIYRLGTRLVKGKSSFYIGLLNGLMPCGPLQTMQLYALSTGSVIKGALSMFLFSMGTTPLMFGFGTMSGKLNKKYAKNLLTISACIIFALGIGMVGNGFSLSGISTPERSADTQKVAVLEDGKQSVTTEIDYGSYESFTVKSGIPVVWTIHVPKGKLTGCNSEIRIPAYDVDVKLSEGDNIVEFTPKETGKISYSCWMGMIKSRIYVTDGTLE